MTLQLDTLIHLWREVLATLDTQCPNNPPATAKVLFKSPITLSTLLLYSCAVSLDSQRNKTIKIGHVQSKNFVSTIT